MTVEQEFFNQYRLMYRPFINQLNVQLETYQLYSSQWAVLRFLKDKGPHSFVDIANFMSIEKPSVTKLVHKLVELGYVETVVGKDKREKLVHLSTYGEELVQEIKSQLSPFFEQALAGVPQQDIEIATQVLARICMNINQ
ncbi:MarR family winged helix-turn-helix transcriptional regulator [Lysinibacillus pakistanensis]|uniref:MarR family transcriptional regulator n=1 Tax=Lysinibacillus pakistanensis TaxID=759811 RepID=A0AAX3X496_9BACI|nr:MarR family transcriptional regulator [Lysinibacillus pakistanensis]MDM5233078.1 MarR family transcriptional regulator [Lysinibacillus pakistanensis]QGG51203.1 MarR family transcriptional regulator [Lysinibacillus pakistanensis]WHY48562.1 MarR family transcriptional regulator [Lysinibacillus pakistanensis]WHY53575.1 MarR family transcriptional regulator [Lysinibacillus pakistanensis]